MTDNDEGIMERTAHSMSETTDHEKRLSIYGRVGILFSFGILLFLVVYSFLQWTEIKAMTPNEFGDFLAGILGPLALLWLVLGFFQQGEELRHSVRALELQSEELRKSVEQQAALVQVTREQTEAELAALQEERQARRAAVAPRFTIHADGGMQSGGILSLRLVLHNVGAMASDTRIILRSDTTVFLDRFFSVFEVGSRESFSVDYTLEDRPRTLIANLLSRDRFGEEVTQVITLEADQENSLRYFTRDGFPVDSDP